MPRHLAALACLLFVPGIAVATDADTLSQRFEGRAGAVQALNLRLGPYPGPPEQAARAFLVEHELALGLSGVEFALHANLPAHDGRILRLQRLHEGVPVAGTFATVKLDHDGMVRMARVDTEVAPTVATRPTLSAEDAAILALDAAGSSAHALHAVPQPELTVLPRGDHELLVWRVPLSTPTPVRSVLVSVDAHSGSVLSVQDLRREASGWAWDQSPLDGDPIEVELEGLTGDQDVMTGGQVTVQSVAFDGGSQIETSLAVADDAGDFFYEPDEDAADDAFAEVHAYFHLETLRSFFVNSLGHEFDNTLQATVNYREDEGGTYDNAYFTQDMQGNDLLVFGQGTLGDFCYDTDIIAHEHGHAIITARTAFPSDFIVYDDYGWNNAIGGIHEGVADFWAGSYQGDSMVGEYIPVRDMDNDASCPEDLSGESHEDGEIVGGATWDMAQVVGMEAAELIVYEALGMLSDSPTYAELAETCIAVATELAEAGTLDSDQVDEVVSIMEERGMLRCGRALELSIDEPVAFQVNLVMGLTELPEPICSMAREGGFAFTMPFQLAFTTPPASEGPVEAVQLDFAMERVDGGAIDDATLEYGFYVRKDELVTFDMESVDTGMGFALDVPHAREYDLEVEDNPASVVLDPEQIELESDTTYYLAMRHVNCAAVDMTITTQLTLGEPAGDTGLDEDTGQGEPDPKDCGCSQGAGPASTATLLGLLGLCALQRRRLRKLSAR